MKLHKYTELQLREAVKNNLSFRQVLLELKVEPYGGNYDTLRKAIQYFKIDNSHFTGQAHRKGQKLPKKPIEEYLCQKNHVHTSRLKKRLIDEHYFDPECVNCGNSEWLGTPIPLELDHVDGNSSNNELVNLRLLCPNCHALTPTYRGKNKKK